MKTLRCLKCNNFNTKKNFCKRLHHLIESGFAMRYHGGFIDEKPRCENYDFAGILKVKRIR